MSDQMTTQEQIDNAEITIMTLCKRIAELEKAVWVMAIELARVPELVSEAVAANPIASEAVRRAGG
jgi:hypothetical protein